MINKNIYSKLKTLPEFAQTVLLKLQDTDYGYLLDDQRMKVASLIVPNKIVDTLLAHDLVTKRGNKLYISTVGRAYIRRKQHLDKVDSKGHKDVVSPYVGQHKRLDRKVSKKSRSGRTTRVNMVETPLSWLLRRKGRDGNSMISKEQYIAGERLREDFILSGIAPHVTMNYDAVHTSKSAYHGGCGMTVNDHTIAAKKRLDTAVRYVGPELSNMLMRVCCHLDGLEASEKHFGWPVRSGKVVLSIALNRLICHYNNHIG